jgi:hypothetical protein
VTVTDAAAVTKKPPIWQRHRRLAIATAILVIALITVLTDLPTATSRASDIAAERSVMSEVNSDLQPCAYAIHQALGIWALQANHRLSAAERAPTPGLLSDDQSACSFTSQGIYDLTTNIQVPGTTAGKDLGDLIATATLWTTSDALRVIEDVQTLMNDPNDAAAVRNLSREEAQLASDRRSAVAEEDAADRDLDTHLQPVDLPPVPATASSSTSAPAS